MAIAAPMSAKDAPTANANKASHMVCAPTNGLVESRPLIVCLAPRLAAEYSRHAPLQHAAIVRPWATLLARLFIERAQRIDDLVQRDQRVAARRASQRGRCLDVAGIRRPRGENRALFVQRQVGIVDVLGRMRKRLRGMQKIVKVETVVACCPGAATV